MIQKQPNGEVLTHGKQYRKPLMIQRQTLSISCLMGNPIETGMVGDGPIGIINQQQITTQMKTMTETIMAKIALLLSTPHRLVLSQGGWKCYQKKHKAITIKLTRKLYKKAADDKPKKAKEAILDKRKR